MVWCVWCVVWVVGVLLGSGWCWYICQSTGAVSHTNNGSPKIKKVLVRGARREVAEAARYAKVAKLYRERTRQHEAVEKAQSSWWQRGVVVKLVELRTEVV